MTTPIKMNGALGESYTFDVYSWNGRLPEKDGVYAVLKMESDTHLVLYVGQAENLSERLADHEDIPCFIRNGRTHIGVLLGKCASFRSVIVDSLLEKISPTCHDPMWHSIRRFHHRESPYTDRASTDADPQPRAFSFRDMSTGFTVVAQSLRSIWKALVKLIFPRWIRLRGRFNSIKSRMRRLRSVFSTHATGRRVKKRLKSSEQFHHNDYQRHQKSLFHIFKEIFPNFLLEVSRLRS